MSIRVLIVDDQELFRDAIAVLLRRDERIEEVVSVASGAAAIEHLRAHAADVVLMDIRMPGMDGIAATREVLRVRPGVRVLILTTFDLDEYVYAAIREGASGFLTKDTSAVALTDAAVAVAAGDAVMSQGATRSVLGFVRDAVPPAPSADALAVLSEREQEVTRMLATGASNEQIARSLFLSANTVKTHVKAVLAKLGLPDRVHVVIWAYENGVLRPGR
ncbi:DNA-binding NarL/FixJ family response regulator [Microbacterium sp. W4I4]|uniref:response regulator transcription factor n=1 Tax=Microbacterium sp. W4I4 TaxID=3042295 RepID=UPI00278A184F|nr:response regulator transcription factor [Microbacterium sp. W4I4]MDQ0614908.1 DNA-binding NarL/FixJ family response regulator [Microbacterium sp. W4I4]